MRSLFKLFFVLYLVLRPVIPMMDYVLNYDYISKVLCINKTRPQLMCNGKCYLVKELVKSNDNQNISKDKNQLQKVLDVYLESNILVMPSQFLFSDAKMFQLKVDYYCFQFENRVLKPPIF